MAPFTRLSGAHRRRACEAAEATVCPLLAGTRENEAPEQTGRL